MQVINSKDNPLVKRMVSIMENKKDRQKNGLFAIEGLRFCRDAVLSNVDIKTVLLTEEFKEKHSSDFDFFCSNCADVRLISDAVCKKLGTTVNSQGVFCLCSIPENKKDFSGDKYIVLENLQDPGNIGTVIRTAEAFGINAVILAGNCADIYSPKVLRSTMGSIFRIPIFSFNDISELKMDLTANDIKLFGAVLNSDSKKLSSIFFPKKVAIAIGNEANGLSENAKELCDDFIFIEMNGNAESLNAAVAASILMWELQKS